MPYEITTVKAPQENGMREGRVDKIRFRNDDNGYSVLFVDVKGKRETWVGTMPHAVEGTTLRAEGTWEPNPKFGGMQFKVGNSEMPPPKGHEASVKTLASLVPGVGPKTAEKILAAFGEEVWSIMESTPQRLRDASIKGLPAAKADEMCRAWSGKKDLNRILKWLRGHGLGDGLANRIIRTYGDRAMEVVTKQPYRLAMDIAGIGFTTADKIARNIGILLTDPERIMAGLLYVLEKDFVDSGHCYAWDTDLVAKATAELKVGSSVVTEGLGRLERSGRVKTEVDATDEACRTRVFPRRLFDTEEKVAWYLARLMKTPAQLKGVWCGGEAQKTMPLEQAVKEAIAEVEAEGFKLSEAQSSAMHMLATEKVMVITGSPGTGKSSVVKCILRALKKSGATYEQAAPTGKAAKRIREITGEQASTIHSLLGFDPSSGKFIHNEENTLPIDVLVADECFHGRQQVLTEEGWKEIRAIVSQRMNIRVWSKNPTTGELELKPVIRWLKHDAPKTLLKINAGRTDSTRDGRTIRCTPDHKIMTPNGYVKAGDLRVGDSLVVRGRDFTPIQKSVLIGSMLGDGNMGRHPTRNSPQPVLMNGVDQEEWIMFKHRIFGELSGEIRSFPSGYENGKPVLRFSVDVTDEARRIAEEMPFVGVRQNGYRRWAPTPKFLEWVDEIALAVWYCDNGHTSTKGPSSYANLHTERFTKEENEQMSAFLKDRFGIASVVTEDGRGYFFLRFHKEESDRLFEVIRPFVPECMSWKVPGAHGWDPPPQISPSITTAPIRKMETMPYSDRYVFDIEVADNHNYIAGNILVSNCSMVDTSLVRHTLAALSPESRLIMVGDVDQLPSVGAGAVLRDIITSECIPTVRLTQIFRQAAQSSIITNSHAINSGKMPTSDVGKGDQTEFVILPAENVDDINGRVVKIVTEIIPQQHKIDAREVQVLCPKKDGQGGVHECNTALQKALNPDGRGYRRGEVEFRVGDRVIHGKNDYARRVFNGDVGYVIDVFQEGARVKPVDGKPEEKKKGANNDPVLRVRYDDDVIVDYTAKQTYDLMLAYACTVHRMQGSENKAIVMPVLTRQFIMLSRNLVYTGVTRAKKLVVLLAEQKAMKIALAETRKEQRNTRLAERIRQAMNSSL